jgi:hypothetical protein
MSGHQALPGTISLAIMVALSVCGQNGAAGLVTPTPVQASAEISAPLTVQVDQICAGRESNIKVLVDFVQIGVTNPGDAGVSLMVTVGDHQLSAVSQRGTLWGPFPTTVPAGGSIERLGCMPADAI